MIVPPSLRDAHRAGFTLRRLETGEARILGQRVELIGMRGDGSEFPVELTVTRIDAPGAPLFTAYLRDITDRRTAEQELRAAHSRLESIGGRADGAPARGHPGGRGREAERGVRRRLRTDELLSEPPAPTWPTSRRMPTASRWQGGACTIDTYPRAPGCRLMVKPSTGSFGARVGRPGSKRMRGSTESSPPVSAAWGFAAMSVLPYSSTGRSGAH